MHALTQSRLSLIAVELIYLAITIANDLLAIWLQGIQCNGIVII